MQQHRSPPPVMVRLGAASSVVALAAAFLLMHCAASSSASLLSSAAAGSMMEDQVGVLRASPSCDRSLGQCSAGGGEVAAVARRGMAARQPRYRYISYAAMRADQVPCNQRGRSYYSNCGASQQPSSNPYRRGCSAITRCARNTREE